MCVGDQGTLNQRRPPTPAPSPSPTLRGISGAVRDPQFWQDVGGNVNRTAQGLTAGVLGAPVDIASAAVRPFAQMAGRQMPPEGVVGSTEWFGEKMGHDTQSIPWLAGSFGPVPDAGDAMRMAGKVDQLGPMALAGITAWHGSPHRFAPEPGAPHGRFRDDRIGTGEGAQAYGHGAYLAEAKGTAQQYAKIQPARLEGLSPEASEAFRSALYSGGVDLRTASPEKIREWQQIAAEDVFHELNDFSEAGQAAAMRIADEIMNFNPASLARGGSVYKVDLPDEHLGKMLDWDARLSEQPPEVRRALEEVRFPKRNLDDISDDELAAMMEAWDPNSVLSRASTDAEGMPPLTRQELLEVFNDMEMEPLISGGRVIDYLGWPSATGRSVYKSLSVAHGGKMGGEKYSGDVFQGSFSGEGQRIASEKLREAGIPGSRYLDGASRKKGEGTANYVLFDPSLARILGVE